MNKTNISYRTKSRCLLAFCVILFILLQVVIMMSSIRGTSQFNGVYMAFQFGLCIIMCRTDYRIGYRISIILNIVTTLLLVRTIIFSHDTIPISGLFNTIIYIASLTILSNQFKKRDIEALTDMLTGLLNRRGLYNELIKRTGSKKPFHVIYIDIDNFKMINDNYGHTYGDILLKEISGKIVNVVDKAGIVTRIGGDEFVIILNDGQDEMELADSIIKKISECISLTLDESTIENYMRAYAGIASYPRDSRDYEQLLKFADIAMFESAKENATSAFRFSREMESAVRKQVELELIIKESLANNYFYLMYQPQFNLDTKELRGFEALLRAKLPTGAVISPADFIPVAEKSDLIRSIDEYVLDKAINELKAMLTHTDKKIIVSVNVSAQSIAKPEFVDYVITKMSNAGIGEGHLEIEITEYCLVKSVDTVIQNINRLKSYGIKVALDDFGTGYTSLSYLFKMPIDLLKIDKSLIDDIEKNDRNRDFVNTVASLGHLMGCEVISEGVENENQLSILRSQNCDYIQGFVWGRPAEYENAIKML